jgi:hypothetical protein
MSIYPLQDCICTCLSILSLIVSQPVYLSSPRLHLSIYPLTASINLSSPWLYLCQCIYSLLDCICLSILSLTASINLSSPWLYLCLCIYPFLDCLSACLSILSLAVSVPINLSSSWLFLSSLSLSPQITLLVKTSEKCPGVLLQNSNNY